MGTFSIFEFKNNKKGFVCIFYQVNNLFLHRSYLKSPLPGKLTSTHMSSFIFLKEKIHIAVELYAQYRLQDTVQKLAWRAVAQFLLPPSVCYSPAVLFCSPLAALAPFWKGRGRCFSNDRFPPPPLPPHNWAQRWFCGTESFPCSELTGHHGIYFTIYSILELFELDNKQPILISNQL